MTRQDQKDHLDQMMMDQKDHLDQMMMDQKGHLDQMMVDQKDHLDQMMVDQEEQHLLKHPSPVWIIHNHAQTNSTLM
ncbi:MAG: hypothetical protein D3921_08640 [Candidatus Electrothrix sp. AW1]|nr:hypothetical protein [Candidatus Electrothrix sp. AX1]MCI5182571.1 hypothetical protein [Candidatus Electrothrix gigas]